MIRPAWPPLRRAPSKPRASGDDPHPGMTLECEGHVNPARAGMIPRMPSPVSAIWSKPRASGDDPGNNYSTRWSWRVNPARAGMIRSQIGRLIEVRV